MDKSMLGDLDALPEEDKLRMTAMINQLQIRDTLRGYNLLVEDVSQTASIRSDAKPWTSKKRPASTDVLRSS